jgi:hypothetical protein
MTNRILYESADRKVVINDKCNFWVYVLLEEQRDVIMENFKKENPYISAYTPKKILEGDIVMLYVKSENKKVHHHNGFFAVGQTISDMKKNNNNVQIFVDKNLNRHIVDLESVNFCDKPYKIGTLCDIPTNKIKGLSSVILNGDSTFNEMPNKSIGFTIAEKLYSLGVTDINFLKPDVKKSEKTNIHTDQTDQSDSSDDPSSDDSSLDDSNSDEPDDQSSDQSDKPNDSEYQSNIPILMITCKELKKTLKLIGKKKVRNKNIQMIETILWHYKFCRKCDITNNNSRELQPTLNSKQISEIEFAKYGYDDALCYYLALEQYPKEVNTLYIKIYLMKDHEIYKKDILIEYTSKMEQPIDLS